MSGDKIRREIEVLTYKRDSIMQKIDNLLARASALTVHSEPTDLAEFKVRFDKLNAQYEGFNRFQGDIAKLYVSLKEITSLESLHKVNAEMDDKYFKIVTIRETLIPQEVVTPKSESEQSGNGTHAKLPKITLPCFDGTLKDWPSFKDLFKSLVHDNKCLPDIEKFHYLLSCTKGEPHFLVRSLPISAVNYEVVYNQLLDRYDNKRLLATHYIDEIFNSPLVTSESPKPLRNLLDVLNENMQALKSIEVPGELGDFIILQVALKKIDRHTRQLFERKFVGTEFPSLDDFLNFLREHCKCLDVSQNQTNYRPSQNFKLADGSKSAMKKPVSKFVPPMQSKVFLANLEEPSCLYCSANHLIYACQDFSKLSVADRRDFVKTKHACFNCLSSSHMLNKCNSVHRCKKCSQRHHTSLHDESYVTSTPRPSKTCDTQSVKSNAPESHSSNLVSDSKPINTYNAIHSATRSNVTTLLGTAFVQIKDNDSRFHTVRALIDPGSQGSFISDSCVTKLNLPRHKCYQPIMGLSETAVLGAKGYVSCILKPQDKNDLMLHTNAIILNKITSTMPTVKLHSALKQHFNYLSLADPNFDIPGPIDFLLGADLFPYVFDGGRSESPPGYPTPFHTIFGWVLIGPTQVPLLGQPALSANLTISDHCSLDTSLKRFWEIEEIPARQPRTSPEEELCENNFVSTHSRDQTGRYIVQLPFKSKPPILGNSFHRAKQCLLSVENRLHNNNDLKTKYLDFLQEYEDLGHMTHLSSYSPKPAYFIPHHGVFKASDSTRKLRVVFNASAKTDSRCSLNDELLIGPKLQSDICQILSRFRLHPIVFCTDICKMYRQILIHPDHRQYQTILWRKSPKEPIDFYSLNTVTYGVASSPFLALRTLRQLVFDEGNKFPLAAQAVLNDMFVDDCITGAPTLEEAKNLKTQLISLMKSGGFELSKWSSNARELDVSTNHQELVFHSVKTEDTSVKVLGLKWLPKADVLSYNAPANESPPTKRGLLSYISKIFDPLGLATPTVFWAKQLMQQLWTLGLNWDDRLPDNIYLQWTKFCEELPALSELTIPRFIATQTFKDAQLHGFCDASEVGYACCIYLRITNYDDSVSVHLVLAKSKVAPLKRLTIPKLELCGAYLLCKLIRFYRKAIEDTRFSQVPFYSWTDSKVCLSWIHTSPHLLKTFVGNRLADIQDALDPSHWSYVPSGENPADCASRGIMPSQLIDHSLWWHGPDFLRYSSTYWPTQGDLTASAKDISAELRPNAIFTTTVNSEPLLLDFIQRFSSFRHLQRCTSWILRFINNCRNLSTKITSNALTVTELNFATITLVKLTQRHYFSEDIKSIKKGAICSTGVQRLQPFFDTIGVIRVGGRIRQAELNYDAKHPMLIPKQSHFADLIIDHFHKMYLHAGPRLLQSIIVRQFWIISARHKIRHLLSKCLTCIKFKAKVSQPLVADLPRARIKPSRPFMHCGVDYGGPFLTKTDKLRKPQIVKSYICLFVCLATKAIHLELVSSLSSEAFLAGLTRFFSRRGLSSDIYSDQGTNFVGASREINELFAFVNRPDLMTTVQNSLAARGVNWHFNPPATPHFGGIWEAGIKSTKFHLKHVIGEQKLTFEELYTLLTSIEAILNSRPLCQLSADPEEFDTLTPGHFLIGEPLLSLPQTDFSTYPINRLSRWQLVQQQTQHFWKRWSREYLHTLQQREKWTTNTPNLKIDDLVLIKDTNLPVMSWITGRVKEIHPGTDGVVRVATLQTKQGQIKRPVVKLCPLPIN